MSNDFMDLLDDEPVVLSDSDAKDLLAEIPLLQKAAEETYFVLGQKFLKVAKSGCYTLAVNNKTGNPCTTFSDYLVNHLDMSTRKVYYWMKIAQMSNMYGIEFDEMRDLGLSRAYMIFRNDLIKSREDFEHWAAVARSMSVEDLRQHIKSHLGIVPSERDEEGNPLRLVNGRVHHKVTILLDDDQYNSFKAARDHVSSLTGEARPSYAVDMICLDYSAHNVGVSALGDKLSEWFRRSGDPLVFQHFVAEAINSGLVISSDDAEQAE